MTIDLRRATLAVLILLLLTTIATAHGGAFRGPRGVTPGSRVPSDMPSPPGPTAPPGDGPITPPQSPGNPGPVSQPERPPAPATPPRPASPRGRLGGTPVSGPSLSHWVYWWNLNRERILNLRSLQAARLRASSTESSPHFLGEGGDRNVRQSDSEEARQAIVAALLTAAEDDNADVATGAILALGKAGDPTAIPLLTKLVDRKSADRTVRESAALALGMVGTSDHGVRAFLVEVTRDEKRRWRTRAFATLGLGFLDDAGAIPSLMSLWRGKAPHNEVSASALLALGLVGDEILVPDLAEALSGRPERREKDDQLRAHTAAALGMIRSRAAIPALMRSLRDPEKQVRRQATLSIAAMAGPEDETVVKLLLHVLAKDRDSQTRAFAAVALGEIGSPKAADHLLYAYRKGDGVVVPYAALGLALLARNAKADGVSERIVPFLRAQFLERKNVDLRGALALSLGIVGDREAVEPLVKLLKKPGDPTLRGHVAVGLGLIGAKEAAPALRKALTDRSDPTVKREIALALGLLGDREATAVLIDLVKNGRTEYVRGSAATAVGRLVSTAAALELVEVLKDPRNPNTTRAFVAVALGLALDRHEVPLLSRVGEHFNYRMVVASVAELLTFL